MRIAAGCSTATWTVKICHATLDKPVGIVDGSFGKASCSSHATLESPFAATQQIQNFSQNKVDF
jgi:hypothetical protein